MDMVSCGCGHGFLWSWFSEGWDLGSLSDLEHASQSVGEVSESSYGPRAKESPVDDCGV